ncbi:MAG: hypothetical protein AB7U73_08700 [Pirellulales bacterium]
MAGLQHVIDLRANVGADGVSPLTASRFSAVTAIVIVVAILGGVAMIAGVFGLRAARRS